MKTNSNSSIAAAPPGVRAGVFACVAAAAALLLGGQALANHVSTTYTLDAEFDFGVLSGVNHTVVNNQLQLSTVGTTAPILWIANAGEDTVSKFDTVNNKELARYRTWFGPTGQPGYFAHLGNAYAGAAPSRTAVDLDGNAFVLNRHFDGRPARLFKIVAEGGIDRNANSVIDTSADTNNDGLISAAEMKDMADNSPANGAVDAAELQDERVAWSVTVGPANGLGRALCIGTDGHLWVGMYNTRQYYKVSSADGSVLAGPVAVSWTPYGCAIDRNGVLWSASLGSVLGKITNTASNVAGSHTVSSFSGSGNYGIGLGNNKVYLGSGNQQFDPATNTFAAIPNMGISTAGIVIDGAGNIVAGFSTVRKVSPAGALVWQAPLQAGGSGSIGIQVDSNNDVWQVGFAFNGRLAKYRGTDGAALGTFAVGNMPYTYSDASGLAARTITNNTGTWTVIRDAGNAATEWGKVSWSESVPLGASVGVRVRAADVQANLPLAAYTAVTNNVDFSGITGRFIQVETRLNANVADESPLLYDLTVASIHANDPPTVDINTPTEGQLFSTASGPVPLSANLADPNTGDTHTCTINWDNGGAAVAGTVNESAGSGTCTGSQALSPGVYNLVVTVRDGEPLSATDTVMIVVYDPTGGFVTGGGWINSPAGAFTLNPALVGKANFGFVSKYQKGATTPTGQTEFQFHVANLNFHSSSYDWLVVAGAKAQYKGTGTVNGEGDYGFMLTATDEQVTGGGGVDKFRIKIWNKATGVMVYDNQLGDADDAAATLAIAGGNIVVHTKK